MGKNNTLKKIDEITVLVFKDNESARTFRVSLGWISRLGFLVSLLVGSALLSSFFALKFYRLARKTAPTRVIDLEQELSQLKATNKQLESRVLQAPPALATQSAAPVAQPAPPVAPVVAPLPVQASTGGIPLFSALPRNIQDVSTQTANLPITVSTAKVRLNGKSLRVTFNLQYTSTDGGSQQGRIIILARGTSALLAYPDGVINRAGTESLVAAEKGEYFSVSRFREVNAEFDQLRTSGQIIEAEILILNIENQLIFYQKVPISGTSSNTQKPKKSAENQPVPASDHGETAPAAKSDGNSEIIQPGVDQ